MSQDRETNLALFIDFDNVALGARDARQRFDIKPLLERLLEKGKIIVKKAYADWHYYKEHMSSLHEAAIELTEIPMPRISGKNSADIKLVVDAMDLCYSKDHIDTFVIVSGDSDFSPLVSKLRENNKRVIGIGVKNSSSKLLIGNCDEFIFYDDIYRQTQRRLVGGTVTNVPADKRDLFDFLIQTVRSLLRESSGRLYSSLIKDTMPRKQPAFTERAHGFSTFGDLLDEARKLGLLNVERDAAAGGTWVVQGLGSEVDTEIGGAADKGANGGSRTSRRRRRSGRGGGGDRTATEKPAGAKGSARESTADGATPKSGPDKDTRPAADPVASKTGKETERRSAKKAAAKKTSNKKTSVKKTAAKKPTTKKTTAKKTTAKKTVTKSAAAKKPTTKKAAQKGVKKTAKKAAKKAPAK